MKLNPLQRSGFAAVFLLTSLSSQAAVTHWRVVKGPSYLQAADNTPDATATNWSMFGIVETDLPGDAASVVITGGNIAGSIAYDLEGSEWELGANYSSKAALDAVFPSSADYHIILSGGTLGTVTQQFSFAADAYPNTPYLTGADYSDCLALEALEPFEVNWNNAGTTTTISLQINTGAELDEGNTIFEIYSNNFSAIELPWNLFVANSNYNGYIDFANADLQSGAGGFGIDGDVSFNTALAFSIDTVNSAVSHDDFNGGTNSTWIPFLSEAGKAFTPTNDVLEFTSDAGPDVDSTAWIYDTDALTYTQDWSVAVDISNVFDSSALTNLQEIYFGLIVASDDFSNLFSIENYMGAFGNELFSGADSNGVEEVIEVSVPIPAGRASVKLSFDADTKLLTSAYSLGGDFTVLTNFTAGSWGYTDSDTFTVAIYCGTEEVAITPGQVYADNFRLYGEPAISNEVSLIELEYNRDYEFPDSGPGDRKNWYKIDLNTSHHVETVSLLTAAGDELQVVDNETDGAVLEWYFDAIESLSTPWDPANDGDWTITVGYSDGTFQSTIVPFTQANGSAIPVINKQPLFTSQGGLDGFITNASSLDVTFNTADTNALFVSIDEYPDNDDVDLRFYADSLATDVAGVIPTVHGPLSTTSDTIPVEQGTNWWLLTHAWGRSDYNEDGITFIVVKMTESDVIFVITDDADSDSMPDDWEVAFFGGTNAVNGGANDDFDGDGFTNLEEFIAGINPTNGASVFAVEEPGPSPSGFVINWNSVEGREYAVYWAKTLSDGFVSVTPGYLPYPQNSYTDTVHTVEGCGFYYIDVQLQE